MSEVLSALLLTYIKLEFIILIINIITKNIFWMLDNGRVKYKFS